MKLLQKFILRLVLFMGYGMLGSWLFCLIEQRDEKYAETGRKMIERLRKSMTDKHNLTNNDFDEFVSAAAEAVTLARKVDWSFTTGCSFTLAVLTTVGYGEIAPNTNFGKMFLIPYALVGLPLAMLSLKTSGELILLGLKTTTINFQKKVFKHQNPQTRFIKSFTIIILSEIVLICILAGMQVAMEDWSFLDGAYCWFVTFTTIGLGDYVPFAQYRDKNINTPWKFYLTGFLFTVPFIAGLCLVSSLLNLLVHYFENIKIRYQNVCLCCGQETNSDSTFNEDITLTTVPPTTDDDGNSDVRQKELPGASCTKPG